MISLEYLFILSHFLVKLDAGFIREAEGSHRNNPPRHEIVTVPRRSHIYVQTPGDQVFSGELQYFSVTFFPFWVLQPESVNINENIAYVRMTNGEGLITNLVPFHNGNNPNIQVYRCFIKTRNNTVFASFLNNNNNAVQVDGDARVFVRLPGQHNPVFSGFLHHADGYPPAWLF